MVAVGDQLCRCAAAQVTAAAQPGQRIIAIFKIYLLKGLSRNKLDESSGNSQVTPSRPPPNTGEECLAPPLYSGEVGRG